MKQLHFETQAQYEATQVEGNTRKLHRVWALEANIRWIAEHVVPAGARFGICHGTRNGSEVAWFRTYLSECEVVGTEISPSAKHFLNTVRWDFHEPREEWVGRADFVYTNSHDHARDPERAVRTWMSQLRPGGVLILEHTDYHEQLTDYNCWGATLMELHGMLKGLTEHKVEIFDLPARHDYLEYCVAMVVRT